MQEMQNARLVRRTEQSAGATGAIRKKRAQIERDLRRLDQIVAGVDKSLAAYETLSEQEQAARDYRKAIRDSLKWNRKDIGRNRQATAAQNDRRVHDFLYKAWVRAGRSPEGVSIKRKRLASTLDIPLRSVNRSIRRLTELKIISGRQGSRRGLSRGRAERRFTFPTFPIFQYDRIAGHLDGDL